MAGDSKYYPTYQLRSFLMDSSTRPIVVTELAERGNGRRNIITFVLPSLPLSLLLSLFLLVGRTDVQQLFRFMADRRICLGDKKDSHFSSLLISPSPSPLSLPYFFPLLSRLPHYLLFILKLSTLCLFRMCRHPLHPPPSLFPSIQLWIDAKQGGREREEGGAEVILQ